MRSADPGTTVRRKVLAAALAAGVMSMAPVALAQTVSISVYAAGSLRGALGDVARAFEAAEPGLKVVLTFGASGLLRDRLAGGARADVFASANMEHPEALAKAGRAGPVQRFARNRLCALGAADFDATAETLAERLLDPRVRVGTSTPRADPSGDYTWAMFDRIEQVGARAGAAAALKAKALQLTGGPGSPPPPADRSVYAALMEQRAADVFITYCTNAVVAQREVPSLRRIEVPETINVAADYGVAVLAGASADAARFTAFLLGADGQKTLAAHGFAPR